VATAAGAVALLLAPTADASRYIRAGIYDDAEILYGDPDRVFPILQQLHTKLVRINLRWGGPNGVARRRPEFPADPSDPAYNWSAYDRAVRRAREIGAGTIFSILGTPRWANGGKSWNSPPISAIDLRQFAVAAARRYSGLFYDVEGQPIPAVRFWVAWNEPNNPVFLKPQFVRRNGKWRVESARNYARICNAVVGGVKSEQPGAKVACGVTGPRGNNNPNSSRPSVSPVAFLRAMKLAGAKGFDAYAHHPYYGAPGETPSTPPPAPSRGQETTTVTLGNFSVLLRELARLYGNKRVWVTEYGYQTRPPDRLFGVSWAQQADYMEEAWLILRRHPRVDIFIWFLLRDEGQRAGAWESGLYTRGWKRKDGREMFEQISSGRR
jgi:hypothetical protein